MYQISLRCFCAISVAIHIVSKLSFAENALNIIKNFMYNLIELMRCKYLPHYIEQIIVISSS